MTPEQFGAKAKVGISFDTYYDQVGKFASSGTTSGKEQSESLIHYTKLNFARMNRVVKTFQMVPGMHFALHSAKPQTWLVLTEAWCGDAAANVPIIALLADAVRNIQLKLLYRDEHADLMDAYLTNGSRSIPKLISVDTSGNELFTWGPRPDPVQRMVMENKALPETERVPYDEISKQLQLWYAKDRGATLQAELLALLSAGS
jgi:hypothetical protein